MIDTSLKWRVPAGSLVVDGALVISLIWSIASQTEQLRHMNERLTIIEQLESSLQTEPRLRVLERRADEVVEFKSEVKHQLNRIEEKLDKAVK